MRNSINDVSGEWTLHLIDLLKPCRNCLYDDFTGNLDHFSNWKAGILRIGAEYHIDEFASYCSRRMGAEPDTSFCVPNWTFFDVTAPTYALLETSLGDPWDANSPEGPGTYLVITWLDECVLKLEMPAIALIYET